MKPLSAGKPLIYLITKGEATEQNFSAKSAEILELTRAAVQLYIPLIQIREKRLPARLVFELTAAAAEITRGSQTSLLVNDRADIALPARADGVHLTSRSIPTKIIRRSFPQNFIIGVSAHCLSEAENARDEGADFVTFSPIFQSPGKGAPKGLAQLKKVCHKLSPFPVIALGGIEPANYKTVLAAGAAGFAAIRFLNDFRSLKSVRSHFPAGNEIKLSG